MNRLCTYRLGAERLLGTLDFANPPKIISNIGNKVLDLVLGAEEPFQYQGTTTPELEEV